eukprot:TRINITY_DN9477_c0_g1_i2.p1 TRINITY_DN9477_c0_g1~~TRINITY_DN9477_c0_g1_i2.p1  ORF type:complete len:821 (-),score=106.09 TRINITY_DN9477_c0_g1_i2:272-2734(-)
MNVLGAPLLSSKSKVDISKDELAMEMQRDKDISEQGERSAVEKIGRIVETYQYQQKLQGLPSCLGGVFGWHLHFVYPKAREGLKCAWASDWTEAHKSFERHLARLKELTEKNIERESTYARLLISAAENSVGESKVVMEGKCKRISNLTEIAIDTQKLTSHPLICTITGFRSQAAKTYYDSVRIRLSYYLALCFFLAMAFYVGTLTEVFFAAFVDYVNYRSQAQVAVIFWFFWLPFGIILLALVGDEFIDLLMDVFDAPSLSIYHSTVLTAMYSFFRKDTELPPSREMCSSLDFFTLFLIEGWPLIHGFFGKVFYIGYIQGSLESVTVMTLLFLICDFYNGYLQLGARSSDAKAIKAGILKLLNANEVHPFRLRYFSSKKGFAAGWAKIIFQSKNIHDEFSTVKVVSLVRNRSVYLAVAAWGLACAGITYGIARRFPVVIGFLLIFVIGTLSRAFRQRFPNLVGPPYFMILAILVIVTAGCISLNSQAVNTADISTIMRVPQPEEASQLQADSSELPARWLGAAETDKYLVCQRHWGSTGQPISALELGELSNLAYEPDCEQVEKMLKIAFTKEQNPSLEYCNLYESFPRWLHVYFPGKNGTRGTRVIAVKGTSYKMDVYRDLQLYSQIELLQKFNDIVPLLQILPPGPVQWLLQVATLSKHVRERERMVFNGFKDSVAELMRKYPGDDFVLTGHSLGGGTAQVTAAALKVPALVWSAPGMTYSAKRFNISLQFARRNIVVIMPNGDVVPQCDVQPGIVQHLECRDKEGKAGAAIDCHSLTRTVCELWRMCGDHRDLREGCSAFVNPHTLGKDFEIEVAE